MALVAYPLLSGPSLNAPQEQDEYDSSYGQDSSDTDLNSRGRDPSSYTFPRRSPSAGHNIGGSGQSFGINNSGSSSSSNFALDNMNAPSSYGSQSFGQSSDFLLPGPSSKHSRSKSDTSLEPPTWDNFPRSRTESGNMSGSATLGGSSQLGTSGSPDDRGLLGVPPRPGHMRQSRSEDYSNMQHLPPGLGSGVGTNPAFLTPDMDLRTGRSSGWGLGPTHGQARSLSPANRTSSPYVPENQRSYTPDPRFQPMGPPSARSLSPAGSLYSHHRRASSERGSATWNPQPPGMGIGMGGRGRPSPYPSPNASPRWPTNDLDSVDPMMGGMGAGDMHLVSEMGMGGLGSAGMMSGLGGMGMSSGQQGVSGDASGEFTHVAKPNVTTGRTANASHRRRKQEATFKCPVPGCGSTFTRSFNLKGACSLLVLIFDGRL